MLFTMSIHYLKHWFVSNRLIISSHTHLKCHISPSTKSNKSASISHRWTLHITYYNILCWFVLFMWISIPVSLFTATLLFCHSGSHSYTFIHLQEALCPGQSRWKHLGKNPASGRWRKPETPRGNLRKLGLDFVYNAYVMINCNHFFYFSFNLFYRITIIKKGVMSWYIHGNNWSLSKL